MKDSNAICRTGSLIAALALATAAGPAARGARQAERPPNVVYIMADDLGYADLGCCGQRKIRTPNIDRLAAGGMRFTQFYSGSPVCAPSRSALMTGFHSGHGFVRDNKEVLPEGNWPIPARAVTVAQLLKKRGYATAAIGKWGLGPPASEGDPGRHGFDLFFGYLCQRHAHNYYPTYLRRNDEVVNLDGNDGGLTGKQYSPDLMESEALRFIRKHREGPFFLYVPTTVPHLALQAPEDSLAEYLGKWDDPPYDGKHGYLPHPHPRAAYAAMVTRMDRMVGRIVDQLAALGLTNNTLIVFTSDNGPTYDRLGGSDSAFFESAGPFRGLKGSVYEGGIRVPFIARWPGHIRPGTTTDLAAANWDTLPSLCELAGVPAPPDIDGISYLPTLLGKGKQKRHDYLYWEFASYGGQQAVRMGDWKGVRQNMRKGCLEIELYDLAHDAGESKNVAVEHPEVVEKIRAIMTRAHTPSEDFPLPGIDPGAPKAKR